MPLYAAQEVIMYFYLLIYSELTLRGETETDAQGVSLGTSAHGRKAFVQPYG